MVERTEWGTYYFLIRHNGKIVSVWNILSKELLFLSVRIQIRLLFMKMKHCARDIRRFDMSHRLMELKGWLWVKNILVVTLNIRKLQFQPIFFVLCGQRNTPTDQAMTHIWKQCPTQLWVIKNQFIYKAKNYTCLKK